LASALGAADQGRVPSDIANLRLAPGFTVRLSVLDDPDFAGTFRVDEHGNLNVPVLGRVHVEGETASDAEVHLQKVLLDGRLLKDPQIELTVVEFPEGEITVLGEVARPGLVAVHGARKLADVLALAGGTTVTAGNEVEISRGGTEEDSESIHYSLDPAAMETTFVRPGDTVLVKRAGIVYVLGAVNRPSGIVMQEKGTLDVLQAIALAGGTIDAHAFADSPATNAQRAARTVAALAVHARRIEAHTAYARSQKNNHGLSEGVGLWTSTAFTSAIVSRARAADSRTIRISLLCIRPGRVVPRSHHQHHRHLHAPR
jgi:protein involved in polysaccharide export with SLBB domain